MHLIDLNSDLGESYGDYKLGMDSEIIRYVSSVNLACGWHAGDPVIMDKTVGMCAGQNVAIGAHPGYPDIMGFGRRDMNLSFAEAKAYVKYQLGALMAFTASHGVRVKHIKAHGAMGNRSHWDETLARALCEATAEVDDDIIMLSFAGSKVIECAKTMGLRWASEVFADRAYNDDYTLVSRGTPGAMIHDAEYAAKRVVRMAKDGFVESIGGKQLPVIAHSVCVHGDNPTAVEIVKNLRATLEGEGITIAPLSAVIGVI